MTSTVSPGVRRAAGLAGLLAAVALVVAARAAIGPATHQQVALPATGPAGGSGSSGGQGTGAAPPGSHTVTGSVVDTPYGPVQVAVVFDNGRIVDIQTVQTPSDAGRSVRLATLATPILRQEVLSAQSAQVDSVSGATYTSEGYAESVQYAIDHRNG